MSETDPTSPMLLPAPDEDSAPFWRAAADGRLEAQACAACGALRHPPRPMCPGCRSVETTWQTLSGLGRIWSWVVVHPPVLPAFASYVPYPVVVVELDDSPSLRMVGNLVTHAGAALNSVPVGRLVIDAPVHLDLLRVDDQIGLPYWILGS